MRERRVRTLWVALLTTAVLCAPVRHKTHPLLAASDELAPRRDLERRQETPPQTELKQDFYANKDSANTQILRDLPVADDTKWTWLFKDDWRGSAAAPAPKETGVKKLINPIFRLSEKVSRYFVDRQEPKRPSAPALNSPEHRDRIEQATEAKMGGTADGGGTAAKGPSFSGDLASAFKKSAVYKAGSNAKARAGSAYNSAANSRAGKAAGAAKSTAGAAKSAAAALAPAKDTVSWAAEMAYQIADPLVTPMLKGVNKALKFGSLTHARHPGALPPTPSELDAVAKEERQKQLEEGRTPSVQAVPWAPWPDRNSAAAVSADRQALGANLAHVGEEKVDGRGASGLLPLHGPEYTGTDPKTGSASKNQYPFGVDEIWKTNFPYAQMVPVAAKGKELTPAPDAGRECCEALLSKNVAPLPPRRGANVCQAQEKGDELVVKISEDEEKSCTKEACGDVVASMAVGHGALYSCVLDGTFRFVRQPKGWHSLVGAPWRAAWPLEPCVPSDCANFDLSTLPRADAPKDDVQKEMQKEMGAWFAPPTELKWTFRGHSFGAGGADGTEVVHDHALGRADREARSRGLISELAGRHAQPPMAARDQESGAAADAAAAKDAGLPSEHLEAGDGYPLIPEGFTKQQGSALYEQYWGKAGAVGKYGAWH